MVPMPTSYPTQNTHRVVVFHPDGGKCDFDRIEDIGADALKTGRLACALIHELQHAVMRPVYSRFTDFKTHLDKRRVLNEDYLNVTGAILKHLEGIDHSDETLVRTQAESNLIINIVAQLQAAVALSNRVLDLLAAERDVGWHRGLGR